MRHISRHRMYSSALQSTKTLWLHVHRPNHTLHLGHIASFTDTQTCTSLETETNNKRTPKQDIPGPFPHVLFMIWHSGRFIASYCGKMNRKTHMQRSWNCNRAAEEKHYFGRTPIGLCVIKLSWFVPSLNSFQHLCEWFLKPPGLSCKIQLPDTYEVRNSKNSYEATEM